MQVPAGLVRSKCGIRVARKPLEPAVPQSSRSLRNLTVLVRRAVGTRGWAICERGVLNERRPLEYVIH